MKSKSLKKFILIYPLIRREGQQVVFTVQVVLSALVSPYESAARQDTHARCRCRSALVECRRYGSCFVRPVIFAAAPPLVCFLQSSVT